MTFRWPKFHGGRPATTNHIDVAGGIITSLKIIKDVSGALPPLQAAVGGILIIVEAISTMQSVHDSLDKLGESVETLKAMIDQASLPNPSQCTDALKTRIRIMTEEIAVVSGELQTLHARGWLSRLISGSGDKEKVQAIVQRLTAILNKFSAAGTISIEVAVEGFRTDVNAQFGYLNQRVNELERGIQSIGDQPIGQALPHATSARFDRGGTRTTCMPDTRTDVLAEIYRWIQHDDRRLLAGGSTLRSSACLEEARIFWLTGQAGMGKSTIAQTVAAWCADGDFLGASFFCSRDSSECSNVQLIFTTIAYQLSIHNSSFRQRLAHVLHTDGELVSTSPESQLKKLILDPLSGLPDFPKVVVIIDALDECKDTRPESSILCALHSVLPQLGPLKFLITSRPEPNIRWVFAQKLLGTTQSLVLHEVPQTVVESDIRLYFTSQFETIAKQHVITDVWPSDVDLTSLVTLSHGLFIFAATAVRYISTGPSPVHRLTRLLQDSSLHTSLGASPYACLDSLYLQVLRAASLKLDELEVKAFRTVLGSIVLLRDRLSPYSLDALLSLPQGTARGSLSDLHSLISVPESNDEAVPSHLIHPSFHDFLVNSLRCKDPSFAVDPKTQHTLLAQQCLKMLNILLHPDMCALGSLSMLNTEVPDLRERVSKCIPIHLQYACDHWASHLVEGAIDAAVFELLTTFCNNHLLHWLEVVSLLGTLSGAVDALRAVRDMLKPELLSLSSPDVPRLLHDCERAVRDSASGLSVSWLQAYHGIIPFCPAATTLHQRYGSQVSNAARLIEGVPGHWGPYIQAFETRTQQSRSLAFIRKV